MIALDVIVIRYWPPPERTSCKMSVTITDLPKPGSGISVRLTRKSDSEAYAEGCR